MSVLLAVGTVLRTLRTFPLLVRTATSSYHLGTVLSKEKMIIQAYVGKGAACACSSVERGRFAGSVASGQRAIREVAEWSVSHDFCSWEKNGSLFVGALSINLRGCRVLCSVACALTLRITFHLCRLNGVEYLQCNIMRFVKLSVETQELTRLIESINPTLW